VIRTPFSDNTVVPEGVNSSLLTDQELIRRIHKGDSDAVAELYQRYAPMVWRFVYSRMGRDTHVGQDVLSETFLAAIRALGKGTSPEHVSAWLFAIARNKSTDWYRRRQESVSVEFEPVDPTNSYAGRIVADVLDELSDEERVVLEWKYLDRFTVREIAERLGKTEKGVTAMLYRARCSFRAKYETALD